MLTRDKIFSSNRGHREERRTETELYYSLKRMAANTSILLFESDMYRMWQKFCGILSNIDFSFAG